LEVGCGTGFVLDGIRSGGLPFRVAGTDLFPAGLEVARRRLPGTPLLQLDARHMPFTGVFDVIAALDVLEHIDEDTLVLEQIVGALRPGGGLVLTVPQHPWLWSGADDVAHHERRYTRRELVSKVETAGMRIVRVTSFVSLLLPLLVLSRIRGRRGDAYELERELALPPALDRAFERVLAAERRLIAAGLSFPAGGSLLLVARKPETGKRPDMVPA